MWEGLPVELNLNLMPSQRGTSNFAHTERHLRKGKRASQSQAAQRPIGVARSGDDQPPSASFLKPSRRRGRWYSARTAEEPLLLGPIKRQFDTGEPYRGQNGPR